MSDSTITTFQDQNGIYHAYWNHDNDEDAPHGLGYTPKQAIFSLQQREGEVEQSKVPTIDLRQDTAEYLLQKMSGPHSCCCTDCQTARDVLRFALAEKIKRPVKGEVDE